MTQLPEDAVAASVHVTRPLEAAGIAYAIGGAVAYGYWGVPWGTVDVANFVRVARDIGASLSAMTNRCSMHS